MGHGGRQLHEHPLRHVPIGIGAPLRDGRAPEDGHVLDPFNGSGTTGLAAFEHGCRYTGIDLNEDYLELSKRRLAQRSLFGIEATA